MTRREKIINEAKKYYIGNMRCYDAFLHGVEFAGEHPKNIWHEASEMPKEEEWILIQFDEDFYDTYLLRHFNADIFCAWCKETNVIRWAYVRDLLPKGGEK